MENEPLYRLISAIAVVAKVDPKKVAEECFGKNRSADEWMSVMTMESVSVVLKKKSDDKDSKK